MPSAVPPTPRTPERLPLERLHIWQFQAVRDVLLIAAVIGLVWLGYALRAVTVPLLIALLLAYLIEPLVARLTAAHPRMNRPIAVGTLMATVGSLVVLIVVIASLTIANQTVRLLQDLREGRLEQRAVALVEHVPEEHRPLAENVLRVIFGTPEDVEHPVQEPDEVESPVDEPPSPAPQPATGPVEQRADDAQLRRIAREEIEALLRERDHTLLETPIGFDWLSVVLGGAGRVLGIVIAVIAAGFLLFLIPFYLFFFSVAYPHIAEFGRGLIPIDKRPRIEGLLGKMDRVIAGFVRGRIIVSLLMGVGFAIGWLWIGVPYAILLGFVIGLFCAVPFLGIIGVPIAVGLLAIAQIDLPPEARMSWWGVIFWPTLVFIVVQAIESYALTPAIAGKATNLDPVTIIVAVLAGAVLMGVYGMLLAIPVAACVKIIITEVLLPRIRAWTRGEAADPLPIGED